MQNAMWGLFVAKRNTFPNFYPIGIFSTKELAKEELNKLPKKEHYQLFELPLDTIFGVVKEDSVDSEMGRLNHEHFEVDEEENND